MAAGRSGVPALPSGILFSVKKLWFAPFSRFACWGLLAAAPASARPAQTSWWFWLSKPERHGSRKLAGDFTHLNTTYRLHSHERTARRTMPGDFKPVTAFYRYHSRERRGLFSFLRRRPGTTARHREGRQPGTTRTRESHMTI